MPGLIATIVFRPSGFDFYDLSPMLAAGRIDFSLARVISHRSPSWERTFRALARETLDGELRAPR